MAATKQILMMGLPGAGKTTLLAALWHMVESKEVPCSLRLKRMEGDVTFLNQLTQHWMEGLAPEHTHADVIQPVALHLEPADGGSPFTLHLPDLAGETYRVQWHHRQWAKEHEERVKAADGLLLLVHSRVIKPMLICDMAPMISAGPPPKETKDKNKSKSKTQTNRPWEPDLTPTQVVLVDLLQIAVAAHGGQLRVAVLVTAWDLIPDPRPEPDAWVKAELPLLHQYMRTNPEWLKARCYGVSAQGGDYEKQEQRERLTAGLLHAERVIISGPDCASHDLTAPIRWLLE